MPRYTIKVIEVLHVSRLYEVVAADRNEAEMKALVGETVSETTLDTLGVSNRELDLED